MSDGTTTLRRWEQNVETGKVLLARGDHARAADAFAAAARAAEHEFGANSLQLGACLTALGQLALQRRDQAGATDYFTRALALRERTLGAEHADVVQCITGLAAAHVVANDLDRAEPLLRRALAITERLRGLTHPEVAQQLNNLAKLYFKRGQLAQAEPLLTRLLVIRRAAGPAGVEVATVLASLATVKFTLGDRLAAEHLWREAISLRERASSPTDSSLAPLLENLADCHVARQNRAEAVVLRQRALGIREGALGADHPTVAAARRRLASMRDGTSNPARTPDASPPRQLSPISVAPVAIPAPTVPVMRTDSSAAAHDTVWWTPEGDSGSRSTPAPARPPTPVATTPPVDASWEPRAGAASAPAPLEVMTTLPAPEAATALPILPTMPPSSPFEPASPPVLSDLLAPAPARPSPPPLVRPSVPSPVSRAPWSPAPPPRPRPSPAPVPPPFHDTPEERQAVAPVRRPRRPGAAKRLFKRVVVASLVAAGAYAYTQRAAFMPNFGERIAEGDDVAADSVAIAQTPPVVPVAPLPDGRPNVPTGPAVAPLPRGSSSRWSRSRSASSGAPARIAPIRPINIDGVTRAIDRKTRPGVEAATRVTLKPPVFTPTPPPR